MDFTEPVNERELNPPRGGWGRRLALGLVAIFLAAAALVAFAPALLSLAPVRALAVAQVNKAIAPARLEVADWSLAWFGGQRLEGLAYADARQGLKATVEAVRLSSLWELLPFGKVTVEAELLSPRVAYAPPPPLAPLPVSGVAPPPSSPPAYPADPAAPAPAAKPKSFALPDWDLSAHLAVRNASLAVEGLPAPLAAGVDAELTLPALDQDIALALVGKVLDLAFEATATTPSARALLAAKRPADFLRAVSLKADSPWLRLALDAAGAAGRPWPEVALEASADCPKALAFAQALGVAASGVAIPSGAATLRATLGNGPSGLLRGAADFSTRGLAVVFDGKRLEANPKVAVEAEVDPENWLDFQIERLSVDFPGALVSGQGGLEAGRLAARVESVPLLETLRPFLGEVSLPGPLVLNVGAQAQKGAVSATAALASGQEALADATLEAADIDVAARRVGSLKLGAKADLAAAAAWLGLEAPRVEAGTATLEATASGAPTLLSAQVKAAVRDVSLAAPAYQIVEKERPLAELAFAATFDGVALRLRGVTLETPVLTLQGQGGYAPGLPPGRLVSAAFKGRADPAYALGRWLASGKRAALPGVEGPVDFVFEVMPVTGASTPRLSLDLDAPTFKVAFPGLASIDVPFEAGVRAIGRGERFAVERLVAKTPYAKLTASGSLAPGTGVATLAGELRPDFDAIWALPCFDAARERGISVSGRETRPFSFEGPVTLGPAGLLNEGRAKAEVAFGRVTLPGLDIPGGEATVTLGGATLALDAEVAVNGGTLGLAPRLCVAAPPYVLTMPEGAYLLRGVGVTQALLDAGLGLVSPLLKGAATPSGAIDLRCDALRVPLDGPEALVEAEAEMTLCTHGLALAPNAVVRSVLTAAGRSGKVAAMPDQAVALRLDGGVLDGDPIVMDIGPVTVRCEGRTDLPTRRLDYTLTVPLAGLLGDRLGADAAVRLPIVGTVDRPLVEVGALTEAFAGPARRAALEGASDFIADKLQERLEKMDAKGKGDPEDKAKRQAIEGGLKALKDFLGD